MTVYVIDTGIRISHNDFEGRASYGYDFVGNDAVASDCHGHGTHVAGTVGGQTYGVAKDVELVAVRVVDCYGYGSISDAVQGVDWVSNNSHHPAVANMSLGYPTDSSLDEAVRRSIVDYNVQYAIAAGNDYADDACNYSPARVAEAMTIGATNKSDQRADFSNVGSCVDWFAPGVNITSAWIGSDSDTKTISGTSMAAPHAAGVAALYLESHEFATAEEVRDALYNATTKSIVSDAQSANDHLLYNLVPEEQPPENERPIADFTYSTSGQTAYFNDQSSDPDGSIVSWHWDFGDGSTSTQQHPSHTYSGDGIYTVSLTVTDNDGGQDGTFKNVTIDTGGDCSPMVPCQNAVE